MDIPPGLSLEPDQLNIYSGQPNKPVESVQGTDAEPRSSDYSWLDELTRDALFVAHATKPFYWWILTYSPLIL